MKGCVPKYEKREDVQKFLKHAIYSSLNPPSKNAAELILRMFLGCYTVFHPFPLRLRAGFLHQSGSLNPRPFPPGGGMGSPTENSHAKPVFPLSIRRGGGGGTEGD